MFSTYREAAETGSRPLTSPRARVDVVAPRPASGGLVTEVLAALSAARVTRGD